MKRYFQSSMSAVALGAMVMSGVVATVSITASPAFSKSNNANSNSNGGNRNDDSNRGGRDNNSRSDSNNGRGAVASSLGALNAAHANEMALENAARNSRVGMIDIYKMAVEITAEATETLTSAEQALSDYIVYCVGFEEVAGVDGGDPIPAVGPTESVVYCQGVLNEAAALDNDVVEFLPETYINSLEDAVGDAEKVLADAKGVESDALEAAANKVTDDEVISALWELLDLPED